MDFSSPARASLFATMILILTNAFQVSAQTPGKASPAELERAKKLYTANCFECHGKSGRGDGPKAIKMGFRPRDFSLGAFKCRCTPSGQLPTDADLTRTILRGMPGTPMQAHADKLSPQDVGVLIQYLKTFSPRFSTETTDASMIIPSPPPASQQAVTEGRQVYMVLQCWKCHGKKGRGDGPAATSLKDDWGQPIKPYNFTILKKFKCGNEDIDFYRTLHTGMNGSPMPSYGATFIFTRENISDLNQFKGVFDAEEAKELQEYIKQQPDAAAIQGLAGPARRELVERRTWSLIRFLRSLL